MPRVRVVIRCRPAISKDGRGGSSRTDDANQNCWSVGDQKISLRADAASLSAGGRNVAAGYDKTFQFDKVFTGGEPQEEFYSAEIKPMLCHALGQSVDAAAKGPSHVVLFAYGQTGSGKTYTMDGKRAAVLNKATVDKTDASVSGKEEVTADGDAQVRSVEDCVEEGTQPAGSVDDDQKSDNDEECSTSRKQERAAPLPGEGVAPRALAQVFDVFDSQHRRAAGVGSTQAELETYARQMSLSPAPTGGSRPPTREMTHTQVGGGGQTPPPFELVRVSVSFLEIYNEKLFDLLNASHQSSKAKDVSGFRRRRIQPSPAALAAMNASILRLRRCNESSRNGGPAKFEVENLTRVSCITLDEALEYYYYGVSKKVFRSHNLNSQSSRAHSIFTIYLTFRDNTATDGGGGGSESPLVTAEIAIVDLAGSERLHSILPDGQGSSTASSSSAAGNQAALISESIHINKSLLTLGKVIMSLSDASSGGSKKVGTPPSTGSSRPTSRDTAGSTMRRGGVPHTPYRDSKLTMVINHALGGNANTLMIACVHLDSTQTSESLSTLFYAARTSKISNTVMSLEDPKTARIKSLLAEVAALKAELLTTNETLATVQGLLEAERQARRHDRHDAATNDENQNAFVTQSQIAHRSGLVGGESNPGRSSTPLQVSPIPSVLAADPTDTMAAELSDRLRDACAKLKSVLDANSRLRRAFDDERGLRTSAERDRDEVEMENTKLREKLDLYDALLLAQIAINKEFSSKRDGEKISKTRGTTGGRVRRTGDHRHSPRAASTNIQTSSSAWVAPTGSLSPRSARSDAPQQHGARVFPPSRGTQGNPVWIGVPVPPSLARVSDNLRPHSAGMLTYRDMHEVLQGRTVVRTDKAAAVPSPPPATGVGSWEGTDSGSSTNNEVVFQEGVPWSAARQGPGVSSAASSTQGAMSL